MRYESAGYCANEEFLPERCPQIDNVDPEMENDIRQSLRTFISEMKQQRGKPGLELVVSSAVEKVVNSFQSCRVDFDLSELRLRS